MSKKSFIVKGVLFIATGMLLGACNNEAKDETKTNAAAGDTASTAETQGETYSLPSPLQIASIFKKSGMKYKDGITTSKKDPAKYTSFLSRTLNLGVYSADLSYTLLNKQNQEAMTYMKLSRQVADNLGIGSVYDQNNISKRFEKNIGNMDSMALIVSELQMVTDMFLDENKQQQITPVVFAGAWIESLYIASKVFENGKDEALNNKLSEQMTILGSIINALKAEEKKEPAINGLIADLNDIKNVYDALPSVQNNAEAPEEIRKKTTLTNDEVATLVKKIEILRTKFINE
jgi:hypothetical protein